MANYVNIPIKLFDDLSDGIINSKMFLALVWLLRRADYSSGVAIKVSARRIQSEMWGDELEKDIPSERTVQEIVKRLDRCGYLKNHHIDGRRGSYAVSMNNFSAVIKGKDGAVTNTVLRPLDTACWRDLPEFSGGEKKVAGCDDSDGDCCGDRDCDHDSDSSAYTTDLSISTDSLDSPASPCSCSDSLSRTGDKKVAAASFNVQGKEKELSLSVQASVSDKGSVPVPLSIPEEEVSDPKAYENAVALCSKWWAISPEPISDTESDSTSHPWGHPRTWTAAQRRQSFLRNGFNTTDDDDPDSLRLIVPDTDPEDDIDPEDCLDPNEDLDSKKEESLLLRDEGYMVKLVRMHGFEAMYELLSWLPTSANWYKSGRLKSLAQLLNETTWGYISADMDKYYAKAQKNNNEESCADYVEDNFLEAGGGAAESLEWERLHPLPTWNPQDGAEEATEDAFDDEYGDELFDPWAEHDLNGAEATQHAQRDSDGVFNPWAEKKDCDPAGSSGTLHARESDEVDDAESEPPAYRYCEDCCSVHAGMCMPDDYSDSA